MHTLTFFITISTVFLTVFLYSANVYAQDTLTNSKNTSQGITKEKVSINENTVQRRRRKKTNWNHVIKKYHNQSTPVVGVLLPLTGKNRAVGKKLRNALEMAWYDFAENNVRMKLYDTQSTPQGTLQAHEKMKHDNVKIIVGPLTGENTHAVKNVISKNVFVLSLSNQVKVSGENVYTTGITAEAQGIVMQLMLQYQKLENAIVFLPENAFGVGLEYGLRRVLDSRVNKIYYYPENLVKFEELIKKVKADRRNIKYDAIVLPEVNPLTLRSLSGQLVFHDLLEPYRPDIAFYERTSDDIEYKLKNGNTRIEQPDGTMVEIFKDLSVRIKRPDGTIVVKKPNGSVQATYPDGTIVDITKDGLETSKYPDGTVDTLNKNWTITRLTPEGKETFIPKNENLVFPKLLGGLGWNNLGRVYREPGLIGGYFLQPPKLKATAEFVEKYSVIYEKKAFFISALMYDLVMLASIVAVEEDIEKKLKQKQGYQGISGILQVGEDGIINRAFYISKVLSKSVKSVYRLIAPSK